MHFDRLTAVADSLSGTEQLVLCLLAVMLACGKVMIVSRGQQSYDAFADEPGTEHMGRSARERILEVAGLLFNEKGYDGTTIRDIMQLANASNATLVKYFENKSGLFSAYVVEMGKKMTDFTDIADDAALPVLLHRMGRKILSDFTPGLISYRSAIGSINNHPQIGRIIYKNVQLRVIDAVSRQLAAWATRNHTMIEDVEGEASRFLQLLTAGSWQRVLYAVQERPSEAEIESDVSAAVNTLVYGLSGGSSFRGCRQRHR